MAEKQKFSGADDNSKNPKIVTVGALVAVFLSIVALALIFMSNFINDTSEDKSYETKTTTQQTVVTPATTPEPIVYDDYPWELNEVTSEQLTSIDEIGKDIAGKIIAFRTLNGEFTSMSQILEIDGIGEKRYNILCEYLYLDGEVVTSDMEILTTTTVKTTTKKVTTKKTTTTPKPIATTTTQRVRKMVNLNTATLEEFMDSLLLTYEEAESIVRLRDDIQYFQNPLEVLYATDKKGKTMFTDSEYNEFKDYLTVN